MLELYDSLLKCILKFSNWTISFRSMVYSNERPSGYIDVGSGPTVGYKWIQVTLCRWQLFDVVTNISKLSPTRFVSNIRHQHRCHPTQVIKTFLEFVHKGNPKTWNNLRQRKISHQNIWLKTHLQSGFRIFPKLPLPISVYFLLVLFFPFFSNSRWMLSWYCTRVYIFHQK